MGRRHTTAIRAADLHNCSPCLYNTRKSAELRTECTALGVFELQDV